MDNIIINVWLFIAIPLLMSIVCISMANSKGDNRNSGAGYRTKRSMQSPENWNFANRTFGYYSIGILVMELTALVLEHKVLIPKKIILTEQIFYINIIILIAGTAISIMIIELRLRKKK